MSLNEVANLRLDGIDVKVSPNATVWWGEAEREAAYVKGLHYEKPGDQPTVAHPLVREHVHARAARVLKEKLETTLAGRLTGTRPVRLEVTIREVTVASGAQRVVFGGTHKIVADAVLHDPSTRATVLQRTDIIATPIALQGVGGVLVDQFRDDPYNRTAEVFAENFRDWLLTN